MPTSVAPFAQTPRAPSASETRLSAAPVPEPPSVLIVDKSEDTREVLRTLLESRGYAILEARCGRQGLEMARRHQPRVIVLDADDADVEDDGVRQAYGDHRAHVASRLLVLGGVDRRARLPADRRVGRPFHFAPLIEAIERLASESNAPPAGDFSKAEWSTEDCSTGDCSAPRVAKAA